MLAGDSALPTKPAFPRRLLLRSGVVGGLCSREGAGLRYRYHNRRRQTGDFQHSMPAASRKMWVVLRVGWSEQRMGNDGDGRG